WSGQRGLRASSTTRIGWQEVMRLAQAAAGRLGSRKLWHPNVARLPRPTGEIDQWRRASIGTSGGQAYHRKPNGRSVRLAAVGQYHQVATLRLHACRYLCAAGTWLETRHGCRWRVDGNRRVVETGEN